MLILINCGWEWVLLFSFLFLPKLSSEKAKGGKSAFIRRKRRIFKIKVPPSALGV